MTWAPTTDANVCVIITNFISFLGLGCLGFLFELLKGIGFLYLFKLHYEKYKLS